MTQPLVLVENHHNVRILKLNRPHVLNALSTPLFEALNIELKSAESDETVRVIILTGNEKAFAAGADISEFVDGTFPETYQQDIITSSWEYLRQCRKPVIAAVSGYALGGGCELALMCDFIIASETAVFGQPEVKIGIMPGAGGTQRLARLIGKSKAMELCLTGRLMKSDEAYQCGLVNTVVPASNLMEETLKIADTIAKYSQPVVKMIKESILYAEESFLAQGIQFERRLFQSIFATQDQKEGMKAFLNKEEYKFKDK